MSDAPGRSQPKPAPEGGISPAELRRRMALGEVTVIDIRPDDDRVLNLTGTVNIPDSKMTSLVRRVSQSDGTIVIVCVDGSASRESAKGLRASGYVQVTHVDGGFRACQSAKLPMVRKAESPTTPQARQKRRAKLKVVMVVVVAAAMLYLGYALVTSGLFEGAPPPVDLSLPH